MKPRPLVPPAKGLSARGSGLRRLIDDDRTPSQKAYDIYHDIPYAHRSAFISGVEKYQATHTKKSEATPPASIVERVSEFGGRHGGEIAFAVLAVAGIVFLCWVAGGWIWVPR